MSQWQSSELYIYRKQNQASPPKKGEQFFSPNRIINRKKKHLHFYQNCHRIDSKPFQDNWRVVSCPVLVWYTHTAVVTPVSRGFLRLQIETLWNKYSFFAWHLTFAHEEFWIRQAVMVVLRGSVLFLTWLVGLPFLSVLVETHSSMTLPSWV